METEYCYKHNPIVRKIFISMLAPTILMNLTTAIGSLADTVIIGHYLDDMSLSVVTFATPIYMIINMFSALFAVGGCIAMSIDSGKGEKQTANKAFSLSMELLGFTGIILLLSGIFFSTVITGWLGAGDDVFELVRIYSQIILLGGPVFVLNIGLAFFVRNDGRPTLSMVGMFLSIVTDIILNVVFVGMLNMGVAGAAYSTVLGQLASVIVIGSHFLSSKNTLKFKPAFDKMALRIIKNGGSTALHFVYQFLTILIINHFLANLAGTNGVVIYTVVFNLSTISLSVFEGISQTIQPMISNYYGEKSFKNIKETLRLAIITIIIICGTVTLLLEIAPQVVPVIFGIDDAALIQESSIAVRIYATSMIIMTTNVVIGYYLQSTEQNSMSAIMISLRCFIIFLSATLLLGKLFGMNGVWAAYTVAESLTFVICIFMMKVKQKSLRKKGTNANLLLLDENIQSNIECYTYNCSDNKLDEYINEVVNRLKNNTKISEEAVSTVSEYLAVLKNCTKDKKKFIEVEINSNEQKVIVRDSLNHTEYKENIEKLVQNTSKSDYGPVLGWNRICLE
ncbi:MAG: MATE family efflux transporter [Clostridia bacterium]|nr:MATE family efflux transporter [Clostridia bacterium]